MPVLGVLFLAVAAYSMQELDPGRVLALYAGKAIPASSEAGLVKWFGENGLENGANVRISDLTAAWAIRAPGAKTARVVSIPPSFKLDLLRVGEGSLFVGAAKMADGEGFRWTYEVDGKPAGNARELETYIMPPESKPDPKVPSGKLEAQLPLTSQVFGGTKHDWWIYTPANFDPARESNLMIFQDGQWAHNYAPVYFDHLIARGELPQTVVLFVTPGTFPDGRSDRSREYDTLNDAYVRFLLEELLPPVEARFKITQDPVRRAVAGLSSGGICSFTCAWERPDKFGLVMSWIGSFTNIASGPTLKEGGHNYPALIRKTPRKPIRVYLQDGENDLDNQHGNWPLGNHQMQKALEFAKYDVRAEWGKGFHSDRHGRARMADALRWLFRPPGSQP